MAKFAVALCILFVASQAQGSTVSLLSMALNYVSKNAGDECAKEKAMMTTSLNTLKTDAASYEKQLNATIAAILKTFNTNVASLKKAHFNDISSCTNTSTEVEEIAANYKQNATTCMDNFVTEMQTSYNTSMENLEGLSANMTNFLEMAEECQSDDIWSFVGCIAEIVDSANITATELFNKVKSVVLNGTTLVTGIQTGDKTLRATCKVDTSVNEFKSTTASYLSTMKQCIAALQ